MKPFAQLQFNDGTSNQIAFAFAYDDGTPVDVTDWHFWMKLRRTPEDSEYLNIAEGEDHEFDLTYAMDGVAHVNLESAFFNMFTFPDSHGPIAPVFSGVWDLLVSFDAPPTEEGDPEQAWYRVLMGSFTIERSVTR